MNRTIVKITLALALVLGGFAVSLGQGTAYARGPIELCDNGVDDDGDGSTDEMQCQTAPTSTPVSADGVVPELWNDNPNCAALGYGYGFKIDGAPNGTFPFTSADGELTGGAPEDPNNSITISNSDGITFDWSSSLPLDAVFVKGGTEGGNLYGYEPEDDEDGGLGTPTGQEISHIEVCYDYEMGLEVEKTAAGAFDRTHTWDVEKSVTAGFQSGLAGDMLSWTWTVDVTETSADSNFAVDGTITITNPSPTPVDFSVTDVLDDGTVADVDCPAYTVLGAGEIVCTYTAAPGDAGAELNTATVTAGGADVTATAEIEWVANVINGTAVVDDDQEPDLPATLTAGQGPWQWTQTQSYTCSSNPAKYDANLRYASTRHNTAIVTGSTGQQDTDSAKTTYVCYRWGVSKTANGAYSDQYAWEITKTVDPASQSGFSGETLSWIWSITWASYLVGEDNHTVTGVITVQNPAHVPITVSVSDALTGGFAATVTCNDGDGGTDLTVGPNTTGTCNYTAAPESQLAQNTATATRNGISFSETVDVNWVKGSDVGLDATISDTNHADIPVDAQQPFQYTDEHTCSTDAGDYGEDGTYTGGADNTAAISWTGGTDDSTAHTEWTCQAIFLKLLKLTDGVQDPEMIWTFNLLQDGAMLETQSTPPALLEFDTVLESGAEVTLCESGIPAGWTAQWALDANGNGTIDDGETLPFVGGTSGLTGDGLNQVYDPDPLYGMEGAVNDTRCVNFVAEPDSNGAVSIIVDNQRPGGDPRTPGYWKNWNTCTGGNQDENAAANGGAAEGWFLLDDLLPTSVGNLIIDTCAKGVSILDRRDLSNNKKKAGDAAYNLASHLLAAKLNLAAGAESCTAVVNAVAAADTLLVSISFNGTGNYLNSKHPKYQQALALAATLDSYNNGVLCSP